MVEQPDSLVLALLRELRADIAGMKVEMATKADLNALRAELKSDMHSLRADIAADFTDLRKELTDKVDLQRKETRGQIVGLRRAVSEYHAVVVGHGILISDLEERAGPIERRLDAPAPGAL